MYILFFGVLLTRGALLFSCIFFAEETVPQMQYTVHSSELVLSAVEKAPSSLELALTPPTPD
jgi:hypothetical protein